MRKWRPFDVQANPNPNPVQADDDWAVYHQIVVPNHIVMKY